MKTPSFIDTSIKTAAAVAVLSMGSNADSVDKNLSLTEVNTIRVRSAHAIEKVGSFNQAFKIRDVLCKTLSDAGTDYEHMTHTDISIIQECLESLKALNKKFPLFGDESGLASSFDFTLFSRYALPSKDVGRNSQKIDIPSAKQPPVALHAPKPFDVSTLHIPDPADSNSTHEDITEYWGRQIHKKIPVSNPPLVQEVPQPVSIDSILVPTAEEAIKVSEINTGNSQKGVLGKNFVNSPEKKIEIFYTQIIP